MKIEYTTTRIGNLKVQTDAVNGKNKVSGIEYNGKILKPTTSQVKLRSSLFQSFYKFSKIQAYFL